MRRTARAIIIEDGYIYLLKRITKKWGVYYSIPGGGIEENETPEQAVIREVEEELSLKVEIIKPFGEYDESEYGNYHYLFLCRIVGGKLGKGSGEEYEEENPNNLHILDRLPLNLVKKETFMPAKCEKDLKKYFERVINDQINSH